MYKLDVAKLLKMKWGGAKPKEELHCLSQHSHYLGKKII